MKNYLILSALVLLSFASCKKEDVKPEEKPGSKVAASTTRYMRADLDGQPWAADSVQGYAFVPGTVSASGRYNIIGELTNGDFFQFVLNDLQGEAITTGTYEFTTQSTDYSLQGQYVQGSSVYYIVPTTTPGTLTISRLESGISTATFSGTLENSNPTIGDLIVVTNGEFTIDNFLIN